MGEGVIYTLVPRVALWVSNYRRAIRSALTWWKGVSRFAVIRLVPFFGQALKSLYPCVIRKFRQLDQRSLKKILYLAASIEFVIATSAVPALNASV